MKATLTIVTKDRQKRVVDAAIAKGKYAAFVASEELKFALIDNQIAPDDVRVAQYDIDGKFTFAFTRKGDGWECHKPA